MTSPSPTHSDSSSSSKHDSNQVGVPQLASLRMCFYSCHPHFSPFSLLYLQIILSFCYFEVTNLLVLPPGQLGDRGGPQGGSCQHEGAQRAGGLPAQAEEVAHEGMAQGERPLSATVETQHLNFFSLLFPRFCQINSVDLGNVPLCVLPSFFPPDYTLELSLCSLF